MLLCTVWYHHYISAAIDNHNTNLAYLELLPYLVILVLQLPYKGHIEVIS